MTFARRKKRTHLRRVFFVLLAVLAIAAVVKRIPAGCGRTITAPPSAARIELELARANDLADTGNLAGAREILQPMADANQAGDAMPRVFMALASLAEREGNSSRASDLLKRAHEQYPGNPDQPLATIRYAAMLEKSGRTEEALALYRQVRDNAPPEVRAPAVTGLGRDLERRGDLLAARDLFHQAVSEARWATPAWDEAVEAMGRVQTALIFSPTPTPESKSYVVLRGDTLVSISNALNTTQGLLMRANNMATETDLQYGRKLKYTPKDFRMVVDRTAAKLYLIDGDGVFKLYSVTFGDSVGPDACGSYRIGNKEKDPLWRGPDGAAVQPGAPGNPLGTRWMPLTPDTTGLPRDFGIHAAAPPDLMKSNGGPGFIRMSQADAEELFDLVARTTPTEIEDSCKPESLHPVSAPQIEGDESAEGAEEEQEEAPPEPELEISGTDMDSNAADEE